MHSTIHHSALGKEDTCQLEINPVTQQPSFLANFEEDRYTAMQDAMKNLVIKTQTLPPVLYTVGHILEHEFFCLGHSGLRCAGSKGKKWI